VVSSQKDNILISLSLKVQYIFKVRALLLLRYVFVVGGYVIPHKDYTIRILLLDYIPPTNPAVYISEY
jgi:hypothetical protein